MKQFIYVNTGIFQKEQKQPDTSGFCLYTGRFPVLEMFRREILSYVGISYLLNLKNTCHFKIWFFLNFGYEVT